MISTSQKTKLNKMNRAVQDVSLGDLIQGFQGAGAITVSAAQSNASAIAITTGLDSFSGQIVQQYRSGSLTAISASTIKVVNSAGTLTVSAPAGIIKTGDVINYITF